MMIAATLKTLAPTPWVAGVDDGDRWGLTVFAGDGKNITDRQMNRDEARFLAALHAFAPRAMLYVEQAAEKGGAEAKSILDDFARSALFDLTPEGRAKAMRRAA